jgi:hypothetical protein
MIKRILIYLGCAVILFFVYQLFLKKKKSDTAKQVELITPKKHSQVFNNNINKVVDAYLDLKNAFVEADTNEIKLKTNNFINTLNKIDTADLRKDTSSIFETVIMTINDIRSNAESINNQHDITEMRKDFSSLTDMMFPSFFYTIKYEGPTLYLQNCPMAFDDSVPANWISNSSEIMNPYLGKKHPKYQSGMLNCGEIKDSITAQ